uniref:Methyltransferase like 24 n=1 Tax=Neogobius melanostomus TaxID=47308 RepID=A0A8C6SW71_9GOBI
MGLQRQCRGLLLLRLGFVLSAVGLCVHLYLEKSWRNQATSLTSPPTRSQTQQKSAEDSKRTEGGPTHLIHNRKSPRWHIDMEPWASESRSLEDEARRFLKYITAPQVSCLSEVRDGAMLTDVKGAWAVCLDPRYSLVHRMKEKRCRVYSFGLGADERSLEQSLATSGCDVHCFDPSLKQAHQQKAQMWLHRLSVDWRDPNPAIVAQQQHANTKKLATILNDFGHRQVDVLKADMESAEWKILENLILEGVLASVGQLLLEVHLHWAGFEVPGDEPSVVRYWFSLLRELQRAGFQLFHVYSDPNKPRVFLHRDAFNASSAYTLSWVNTQWL